MWQKAEHYLTSADEKLKEIIAHHGACTMRKAENLFQFLTGCIVSQQLSTKAADTIWSRFKTLLKHDISPAAVLQVSVEQLREVGMSNAKARYTHNIAKYWIENSIDDNSFDGNDEEEIAKKLISIKGVGQWTADMFLIFALNRPNVLPVGDLAIRKSVHLLYELEQLPDAEELTKIAKVWEPYRSVACWYLYRYLDNPPPVEVGVDSSLA